VKPLVGIRAGPLPFSKCQALSLATPPENHQKALKTTAQPPIFDAMPSASVKVKQIQSMLRRHIYLNSCIYGRMYVCLHICKLAGVIKCNVLAVSVSLGYGKSTIDACILEVWGIRSCVRGYHQSQRIKILLCHIPQTSREGRRRYLLWFSNVNAFCLPSRPLANVG